MIKRDITETVYEYDQEGKLVKKTVTEKHEEEHPNSSLTNTHDDWWKRQITCDSIPNATLTEYSQSTSTKATGTTTIHNDTNKLTTNCTIQG